MIRALSQADMELAHQCIQEVETRFPNDPQGRKVYGGLCHSFPILVRTCGLCQALAFHEDKATEASKPRGQAHGLLLDHIARLLGIEGRQALLRHVREDSGITDYMRDTRRVLAAWIYWKRFAVSILKVKDARDAEDGADA